MRLAELNTMPAAGARTLFLECCGAHRWADGMTGARPFLDARALHHAAERIWSTLGPEDWHEAFAAHPRIGERHRAPAGRRAAGWSEREQSKAAEADEAIQVELAEVNRAYEAKFGHIYLVCASGRSAESLLADARARLRNDPATELRVAADEQRRILLLRVDRLLEETP